ncbi:acetyl-CoA synthetase-like protein [Basidiobolus meristosporus CBS 931.73]|uniref:Acetyl-CoA synthetase-like protein n=1 Tax=Basidiobolus meristosporus CBS 931.73 TaxID=1314790 RepID=A0A1Y1XHD2_9FUNG|nr:acetyl-CoA synthetase-like protein [Basidiobolus meristosporus CBS 931.73]|eukprot:ORX85161.1 acetyl-CoA synthetase-like protein [Basidiobolus meristosporus CBS 931.73]
MIFTSKLPAIQVPSLDLFTFLLDSPKDIPESRPLLINGASGRSYTLSQLRSNSLAFGAGLAKDYGVKRGDVLALFTPNITEYSTICLGAFAAGATVTTANPAYTAAELAHQLGQTKPKVIVTLSGLVGTVKQAMEIAQVELQIILYDMLVEKEVERPFERVKLTDRDIAYICYSSGTSGKPKGVQLTHRNLVANVLQQSVLYDDKEEVTILGVLPFFHIFGLCCILHTPLYKGMPVVTMEKFDLVEFLTCIQKYRVTMTTIVPPIALALARHPIVKKFDISSLENVVCGAAPLSRDLSKELQVATRGGTINQGYGMTETSPVVAVCMPGEEVHGSIGILAPSVEAKILGEDGKAWPNKEGELCVRGPNIMLGYLNNPEATTEVIDQDGFLHTGDVAKVDEDGHFFITDRLKELIKYKGFQVAPAELEALLLTHPAVVDVAVIPLNKPEEATEVPLAYVVVRENVPESAEVAKDIMRFVSKNVVSYKKLRGGVRFIKSIPKNSSGKILRRNLKDLVNQEKPSPKAKL